MGAYHSTKNFEIFETRTNGTGIPHEVVLFYGIMQIPNFLLMQR